VSGRGRQGGRWAPNGQTDGTGRLSALKNVSCQASRTGRGRPKNQMLAWQPAMPARKGHLATWCTWRPEAKPHQTCTAPFDTTQEGREPRFRPSKGQGGCWQAHARWRRHVWAGAAAGKLTLKCAEWQQPLMSMCAPAWAAHQHWLSEEAPLPRKTAIQPAAVDASGHDAASGSQSQRSRHGRCRNVPTLLWLKHWHCPTCISGARQTVLEMVGNR
jgi:hypothetical protein